MTSRIYLLRHGSAPAAWAQRGDPHLDATGRRQAALVGHGLAAAGPMPVFSSPMRRTLETAEPIATLWGSPVTVAAPLTEVPPPAGIGVQAAARWFQDLTQRSWNDLPQEYRQLRAGTVEFARSLSETALLVTHLWAINVLVGFAEGGEQVISFLPANCSVTVIDTTGPWRVVRRGRAMRARLDTLAGGGR